MDLGEEVGYVEA